MNTIALSKINLKAPTQLRSLGEDMSHVEDLAHSYADTGSFRELPWVALIKDTNEYVPIDGFHRLTALKWLAEQEEIECHVDLNNVSVRLTEFDTMAEAIVAAAGVNANHGLKRKSTDIQNAIQKLLEVDRIGFSKNKFTLDSEAIIKAVKCSSATYRRATEEIRKELTDARDFEVRRLDYEGISQREIQLRTGVSQKTISRILSESKRSLSNMTQNESESKAHNAEMTQGEPNAHNAEMAQAENMEIEGESNAHNAEMTQGEEKRHNAKIPQGDSKAHNAEMGQAESEEEPSVFNHITSATVAEDPWAEFDKEKRKNDKPRGRKESLSDYELLNLLSGLSQRQRAIALNYLTDSRGY
ncbi:hypothetical protein [Alteromonas abrolhosensis]|uniref:hypothetical protein n=1 Tax=Alteromonas abrolhosensis TaxID=1892904 RepID=UPI0035161C64